MTPDQITAFISNVGFPIAVAAYLLVRGDMLMRQLRDAVRDLTEATREGNRLRGQ